MEKPQSVSSREEHENSRHSNVCKPLAFSLIRHPVDPQRAREPSFFSENVNREAFILVNELSEPNTKSEYKLGLKLKHHKKLGFSNIENYIIKLAEMGFAKELIEAAVFNIKVSSFEELVHSISKSEDGKWNHKFLSQQKADKRYPKLELNDSKNDFTVNKYNTFKIFTELYPTVSFTTRGLLMKKNIIQQSGMEDGKNKTGLNISQITNSTNEKRDELCFICGDPLEGHDPNYNIKLMNFPVTNKPPIIKFNQPVNKAGDSKLREEEYCMICLRGEIKSRSMKKLICGHYICKICLKRYLIYKITKERCYTMRCPYYKCEYALSNKEIKENIHDESHYNAYIRRKNELILFKVKKLIYCPNCSKPIVFKDDDCIISEEDMLTIKESIVCDSCECNVCIKCHKLEHKRLTCSENLAQRYGRIIRGWRMQTCPICKSPVRTNTEDQYAICPKSLTRFCIYCRKKNSSCTGFKCSLPRPSASTKSKPYCFILTIMLLTILISPILALFVVPYVVAMNVYRWFTEKDVFILSWSDNKLSLDASKIIDPHCIKEKCLPYEKGEKKCLCILMILCAIMVGLLSIALSPLSLIAIIISSLIRTMCFLIK